MEIGFVRYAGIEYSVQSAVSGYSIIWVWAAWYVVAMVVVSGSATAPPPALSHRVAVTVVTSLSNQSQ